MLPALKSAVVAAFGLAVLALQPGAARAENMVVVELFTSQGCSSCPPADEVLGQLAGRDDVIPLSLHVDYWDYLGWRDTFGQRAFGERQAGYRDAWHKSVVYTPQMVIQGQSEVQAGHVRQVVSAISAAQAQAPRVAIVIERKGGMLMCRIEPGQRSASGTIWIAKYDLRQTVEIDRGENAGRSITYVNVVRSLDRIGDWDGAPMDDVEMPQPNPGEGVAVWIQERHSGPILAAAKIENSAK